MAKKIVPVLFILAAVAAVAAYLVTRDDGQDRKMFSGTVEATQVVLSAEVNGRVLEVAANEGDWVEEGDLLVRIDHETLDAQLEQAEAARITASGQYGAVNAGIKNAEVNVKRSGNLLDAGSISEQNFDSVSTQKDVLRAQRRGAFGQIRQAEAGAKYLRTLIAKATLTAPIPGVVLVRSVEPGELAIPGSALLTLADLKNPWVRIYVPETQLGRIRLGQAVNIFSDSFPGKPYAGKIVHIAGEAEFTPKNVQTAEERVRLVFAVKVLCDNASGELKIGMPVDAALVE